MSLNLPTTMPTINPLCPAGLQVPVKEWVPLKLGKANGNNYTHQPFIWESNSIDAATGVVTLRSIGHTGGGGVVNHGGASLKRIATLTPAVFYKPYFSGMEEWEDLRQLNALLNEARAAADAGDNALAAQKAQAAAAHQYSHGYEVDVQGFRYQLVYPDNYNEGSQYTTGAYCSSIYQEWDQNPWWVPVRINSNWIFGSPPVIGWTLAYKR